MKIKLTIIFLLSLLSLGTSATGPSEIIAGMHPISINDKGEVLCKTRFTVNGSGCHWYSSVDYGLAILSDGKIIEHLVSRVSPNDDLPIENENITYNHGQANDYWYEYYDSELDFTNLNDQEKKICIEYGFNENNAEQYKVNSSIDYSMLENKIGGKINTLTQITLKGVESSYFSQENEILISYDFGHIIITENGAIEEEIIGTRFNFINPLHSNPDNNLYHDSCPGLYHDEEYSYQAITGVLFRR